MATFYKKGASFEGFDKSISVVETIMSKVQQSVVLQAARNPASVVTALGKYPEVAKRLADIKNPVKLAAEIARMEDKMKETKRAPQTTPDRVPSGTGRSPASATANMAKLQEQARATGDYSAYHAAKRAAEKRK